MKNLLRHFLGRLLAFALAVRSQPLPAAGGPTLVVAPHADDETLGCGGLLALKAQGREAVQVVFVSDSAGSPAVAGQSTRRRAEALAALQVLGLAPAQVHFIDAPDGRLDRLPDAEARRVHAALVQRLTDFKPAEIFVPYRGGGSTEHDATTALVRRALTAAGRGVRVWEYPVWAWWDPRRLGGQLHRPQENFHLSLGARRALKRRALACHASQCVAAAGYDAPPLPAVLAALCTGPTEFYFHRQP